MIRNLFYPRAAAAARCGNCNDRTWIKRRVESRDKGKAQVGGKGVEASAALIFIIIITIVRIIIYFQNT